MKHFLFSFSFIALMTMGLTSCLKKTPAAPPDTSGVDPHLTVTHTIAQLLAKNGPFNYKNGGDTTLIDSDIVIQGVITANDQSGNIYKQIYIDDSSAGIAISLDATGLYNDYPVGRKIYVKCKGLCLGYNAGTPLLGTVPDPNSTTINRIPAYAIGNAIIKADVGHAVPMFNITMAQAAANSPIYYNRLVNIVLAQFADSTLTFAQPNGNSLRDITQDCSPTSPKIALYNSNYADFAAVQQPGGSGNIMGIYSQYVSAISGKGSGQLVIRSLKDVNFINPRCGSLPPSNAPVVSVDSIRKMYTGTGIILGSYKVKGVVISSVADKNITASNVIIQDGNRGIAVYFPGQTVSYLVGDSVVIDVSSDSLISYKGSLEIKILDGSAPPAKVAAGKTVTPNVITLGALAADFSNLEYTLVKIMNATATGGATYSGSRNLTDATGTIVLYTSTTALFAGTALPAGAHNWTGYCYYYNTTKEMVLRNTNDVQ